MFDSGNPGQGDYNGDDLECFENVLNGTWAPWKLSSHRDSTASPTWKKFKSLNKLYNLNSVDIVITANQDRWTRCAVLEIADDFVASIGDQDRFSLRLSPSVGKDGLPDGSGTMGMSWFPGYAVNVETGERLNMAFGENSWSAADNGTDMVWNPTAAVATPLGDPILGGGHYIYVFGHNGNEVLNDVPMYDEGQFIFEKLSSNNYVPGDPDKRRVFRDAMWVGIPLLIAGEQLLQTDVRVKLRVSKPYVDYLCLSNILNDTLPLYSFSTTDLGSGIGPLASADMQVLVYPNPAQDQITVRNLSGHRLEQLEVYDVSGKTVLSLRVDGSEDQFQVNVRSLPIGIYFLVLRSENGASVRKIIVQ